MKIDSLARLARAGVAAAMALAVLAGCASDDAGTPGNTDVATGGAQFGTADAETAKLGTDAAPGVFPRTVVHATGTTEIPARPQRVVVLDTGELDAVLTLGVTPVGIPSTKGANAVPSYLADRVAGVADVGVVSELNLEAIAALQPDLILGSQLRADKLYPQLSQIAPTVFSIRPGFPWKENFLLVGDSLGMENEATEALNRYAAAAAALKTKVTGNPTISLVRFMPGRLRLYANKSMAGVVLTDAGLARPPKQDVDELAVEISAENIAEAEGDYVFYSSYGDPDATGETSVTGGDGWKALSAVQAGKAFPVNDDVWFLGLGPTGATQMVADLDRYLSS